MTDPAKNISHRKSWLALIFALRELRGGLSGFYVFLACITLGVGAITGVNSIAGAIQHGISAEGQAILGGDAVLSAVHQEIPPDAVSFLESRGTVSRQTTLRAMARRDDGEDQALVELKAADNAYPLYGQLLNGENQPIVMSTATADDAWIEPVLMQRLSLNAGDSIRIGNHRFTIAGTIGHEPDRLSDGLSFGPRVLISQAGLEYTGLIRPGSLYRNSWAVRLDSASDAALAGLLESVQEEFPDAGWRIRSRENAAPALTRNIERFSQFLTLVGLTALVVGGVGVANSVRAFLNDKREVIAIFKSLGAPGPLIFRIYLIQIMILAVLGTASGILLGMATPFVARGFLEGLVPISMSGIINVQALMLGIIYGLLTAFIFAVWPLALARETQPSALFRSSGFDTGNWPRINYLILLGSGVSILITIAVVTASNRTVALVFIGGIAFAFVLLRLVSFLIMHVAGKLPLLRWTELRMAVGNIHRPGSLTPSVVLSLGLGLALISALTLIDNSLRRQVNDNIPKQAPAFFFVDIQSNQMEAFRNALHTFAPTGNMQSVPMLRGRITHLKGIPADEYETAEGQWVLRGDRGITYAPDKPDNASLADGEWWPADYTGEPLVSFAQEEAEELDLGVGDTITVNVLGRAVTARIANLRNVEWESLSINFVMVFSPNAFAGAPHAWLATLSFPRDAAINAQEATSRDGRIIREISGDFPTITSVRVSEAIDNVNSLIGQLANAIRAASSVALIASLLVLAGALAAGNRKRLYDSVILKTLGATRPAILRIFILEYALLGLATALFALAAGAIAAWFIVTHIMQFTAVFDPLVAFAVIILALAATIGLGLSGAWRLLGQKAAPVLREL
jgi:putative ABC transport system permease protein